MIQDEEELGGGGGGGGLVESTLVAVGVGELHILDDNQLRCRLNKQLHKDMWVILFCTY